MRHILIDTDTASDDAVALLMALREPDVRVEAITTVAGNCPLEQCVKNALICVEKREPMPLRYTPAWRNRCSARAITRTTFTAKTAWATWPCPNRS